jgi:hypothetical protein
MERCGRTLFCVCDRCTIATGQEHAAADKACGRDWVCACGACRRARVLQATALQEIDAGFARITVLHNTLARIRKIKES